MVLPSPRFRPSRRAMLRGGAALAVATTTVTASAADAVPGASRRAATPRPAGGGVSPADFPDVVWAPADASNFTVATRPHDHPVEFVVIHVAQETFQDTIGIFQNPSSDVSAHYVVASADGRTAQCVHDADIGWHAGNWDYNTRSIGIEHEGWVDEPAWFTDVLYERSAVLTAHLCESHGIPKTRAHIIGHNEVPGATHTDPGPLWDWERYLDLVNSA
ncbi:peptidoglycan recognition family protein [Streptomyces sp. B6B3]|uniref:N-acetylmuramoyl-L-alanine amidase n=1 Tax=Streptomyces sp. B6B3 TaxID=3153570 RepID=UPI00325DB405